MSNWKKVYQGGNGAHFQEFMGYRAVASSNLNFFFKNGDIRWKRMPRPQNEWFGEVVKIILFNMFLCFNYSLLISEGNSCLILMFEYSFQSLWPAVQEYSVILPLGGL